MDVVYDSELSDIEDEEIDDSGPVRPYMYEPIFKETNQVSEDEDESSFSPTDEEYNDVVPDVSTW